MSKTIDYYICLVSPYTYLGDALVTEIAARHGAAIRHKSMELAKIFPETGGLPLAKRPPARQAYRLDDLQRWRKHRGLPLNLRPKFFPAPEWPAAGMIIAAHDQELDCGPLVNGILTAVWAEDRDIADIDTLKAIAGKCGLDGGALLDAAEDAAVKATYAANSEQALAAGVFGAPSYVFTNELYWGQDRLAFLEDALASS